MPLTHPPAPATLSGDVQTIHRLLQSPALVLRRLRDISDGMFIADRLFTATVEATGGAVSYETAETRYTDRAPRAVAPGAGYTKALAGTGTAALASVTKWGQEVDIDDESIGRMRTDVVNRSLQKLANRIVQQVDSVALAAAAAAITQTQSASAAWSNSAADPFLDVMLAVAAIEDLGEGYVPNALFVTKTLEARLVANQKVITGLRRESTNVVTESGEVRQIAGLEVIGVPSAQMPSGVTAMVVDTSQFGFLGFERIPSPGYEGDPATGVQVRTRRADGSVDGWTITGRRPVVPAVAEPNSAVKVTGA